ncbi:hypothetical protein BDL97_04G083800 [Sphagnum fallax]|jgi:hypothetical protein|nr:hypothetical protein BDL97_04G083800 [Sphagnum fallax]KAH8964780.1 hypothetical protein BDL97_04G083800 [Sphagnum fallax]KAH8964781.1 hypothetical protein BDL97_04G083800 [Sphagnum fallax]
METSKSERKRNRLERKKKSATSLKVSILSGVRKKSNGHIKKRGVPSQMSQVSTFEKESKKKKKKKKNALVQLREEEEDVHSDDGYVRKSEVGGGVVSFENSEDQDEDQENGKTDDHVAKVESLEGERVGKQPKVVDSLKSLRAAIAAKSKEKKDKQVGEILRQKGFSSDDEEEM